MSKLETKSQFANPDAAYVALVEARRGLTEEQAAALDTRLALILTYSMGMIGTATATAISTLARSVALFIAARRVLGDPPPAAMSDAPAT